MLFMQEMIQRPKNGHSYCDVDLHVQPIEYVSRSEIRNDKREASLYLQQSCWTTCRDVIQLNLRVYVGMRLRILTERGSSEPGVPPFYPDRICTTTSSAESTHCKPSLRTLLLLATYSIK